MVLYPVDASNKPAEFLEHPYPRKFSVKYEFKFLKLPLAISASMAGDFSLACLTF